MYNRAPPTLPHLGTCSYLKLFKAASKSVFRAHVTSNLKAEVLADPARFIEADEDLVSAGKRARAVRFFPCHIRSYRCSFPSRWLPSAWPMVLRLDACARVWPCCRPLREAILMH